MSFLASAFVMGASAKDIYGFMTGNGNIGDNPVGMYKFSTTGETDPELQEQLMFQFWGGAFAEKTYYMLLSDDYQGYMCEGLCAYDIRSGEISIGDYYQGYGCSDMTYDCTTETMYGVMSMNGGELVLPRKLITVNLDNGERTVVLELDEKVTAIAWRRGGAFVCHGSHRHPLFHGQA